MTRIKRGVSGHRRHKKVLNLTKGYRGNRSKTFRLAKMALMKAGTNAYRDRKIKKRTFRRLWIVRLNAALQKEGIKYSRFIDALTKAGIKLNRKILSELAINEEKALKEIVSFISKKVA